MSGRIALFVLDAALDVWTHQGPLTAGAHERDDLLHIPHWKLAHAISFYFANGRSVL
jgi:hypothetical protein